MEPSSVQAERVIKAGLARVRHRWCLHVWSRVAARWAVVTLAIVVAAIGVFALVRPAGLVLVGAVLAVVALSLAALGVVGWPWRLRPDDRRVARYAEEAIPELEERLISAADVLERPPDARGPLDALVAAEGARAAASLDLDRILPARRVARSVVTAVAALAALGAVMVSLSPHLSRAWYAARAAWFPSSLALVVEPGDASVVEGGQLALRVRIEGAPAGAWDAPVTVHSAAGHLRDLAPLSRDGEAFTGSLAAGTASFFYRVASGRLVSPEYRVEVRRTPRVERIALTYDYPRFSGLEQRTEDDGGDVFAPEGTRVTLRIHAREAVAGGSLEFAGAGPVALTAVGERVLEGRFVVARDDAYRVTLRDAHGLVGQGDTEFFVRPMEDRPPDVRILRPGGDARVTRLEEVVVEARADDDFGLTRFDLVYAPRGGTERVVALGRGGTSVTGRHTIFVEDLDVRPGDFVTYYARARDVGRGKPSTETRSDIFFLEVRPFNEEFEAAASQAGQSGGDGALEELARLQKDIIVATWRLDRRSGAGKSAQDIPAVARTQADLKARAQQAAQRTAARVPMPRVQLPPAPLPPGPVPPAQPEAQRPSAMQRAADAMGRAQSSLEALNTGAALPHENEALNELLRAQAEIRRRQVARQQSSQGGRGGQSGNQDLSALFDRELQRQQQTNYEQRAQSSQSSDETRREDESLRRLRELAARQDELGRQQQELARRRAQLSGEELKRRLERLTREQEELRRQADELARRLQQSQEGGTQSQRQQQAGERPAEASRQGDASGSGDRQASGASQGEAQSSGEPSEADRLREAAREMAGVSGDLRRESLESAGQRSARALERLRSAERALGGTAPDERRRRAGDLQAQARQMADAERRLAADAAASGGEAEALRRLAAEQSRLAERADDLERAAREFAGREPRGGAGDPVRRAAQDLSSARVGDRLRASADAARASAEAGQDGQRVARQLAETAKAAAQPLERLAERMGEISGQDVESQRLSDSLARARSLRERLGGDPPAQGRPGSPEAAAAGSSQSTAGRGDGPQGATSRQPEQPSSQRGEGSRDGRGQAQSGGGGSGGTGSIDEMRERLLREGRDQLDALSRESQDVARSLAALEAWTPSTSAPGTESWKQDFARWEQLKQNLTLALERHESALSARLTAREARNRLETGADDRPPDAWRAEVADYFKAVAGKPRQ